MENTDSSDTDDFLPEISRPHDRAHVVRRLQRRGARIARSISLITSSSDQDSGNSSIVQRFSLFRNQGRQSRGNRSSLRKRGRPTNDLRLRLCCLQKPGVYISGVEIAKLNKVGLGSTRCKEKLPLAWTKEDLDLFIRRKYPLLGTSTYKLCKLDKRKLEPLPENATTPACIKQWGQMKCSALYIMPDSELDVHRVGSVAPPTQERDTPEQTPSGSSGQIPGSSGQIPGSSGQIPGSSGQIPGSSGQMPGGSGHIPGSSGQIPGSSGQIPGSSGQIPGGSGQIPGSSGQIPGGNGQIPGGSGQIPGSSGQSQDRSVTQHTQEESNTQETTGEMPSLQTPSRSNLLSLQVGSVTPPTQERDTPEHTPSGSSGQIPGGSGQIPGSSGQSQVNYRFVCAGTPTVQFREDNSAENNAGPARQLIDLETRSFITPSIENANNDHNRINEFVPEVLPSVLSRPSASVDNIKEFIQQHRENFVNMQSEDPLLLEVRREHVLMDAIAIIRYSQEDLHNPLQIKFCGEQGVDVGGLRREFWSLFLYQLSHSIFVTGKEGRLSFQPNFLERKKNTFFHLGQLVALSILQDGPGAPIFSECITDYILNGKSNSLDPDDLMEGPKEILEKMATCSSEDELQQQYMTITDYATDAGFLLPVRRFTEKHVPTLQACLIENQVVSCKEELDQFIKGLDTHQLISALQQEGTREKCRGLFSGKIKPVTAAAIRQLLKFKYTDGNKRQQEMVTGQGFLTFLQATKGSGATVNGINLKPKDVLMWLTGATHIPACGFHKSIDVEFGSTTNINTCALCLTLEVKESMTLDEAVTYYTELLINSQTFSKE